MKLPEDVRQTLVRRFHSKHREWLVSDASDNQWPLEVALGVPTEHAALRQVDGVRTWVSAWQDWHGVGTLSWCERRWKALGVQRLPEKLMLRGPEDVAIWIGESERWLRARSRFQTFTARWPALAQQLPKYFDVLADYSDTDFHRLTEMLDWLILNPESNLYPRQIPVRGADSKWLDSRRGLLSNLVTGLRGGSTEDGDFFSLCGLRTQPQLIRMRILDPELRAQLGGLGDISAPYEELANIRIQPTHVFIVENLQTGLAFDELAGSVVIMGLGYAVDILGRIPWLAQAQCIYWGDIDTHGFAILNRARNYITKLESILMDESTLMSHRDLWVEEKLQHASTDLPLLTSIEKSLYQLIKANSHGHQIRLEQERIDWQAAWNVITICIHRYN